MTSTAVLYPTTLPQESLRKQPLWCDGDIRLLSEPMVAVVGSRNASENGLARTRRLVDIVVNEGFAVVSGLAEGIDTVAHEQTIRSGGKTIAVMGTPIDQCYPSENAPLKQLIAERGLVVSQFPPGSPVLRGNFPKRNVLMAALSSVTFVVEADVNSGTRHQVKAAVQMGRHVAFLASLVNLQYPWVSAALDSGLGCAITDPQDAIELLRCVSQRDRSKDLGIPSRTHQEELGLLVAPTGKEKPPIGSIVLDDHGQLTGLSLDLTDVPLEQEFDFKVEAEAEPPSESKQNLLGRLRTANPRHMTDSLYARFCFWRYFFKRMAQRLIR